VGRGEGLAALAVAVLSHIDDGDPLDSGSRGG
jgi:hypothetical protein